MCKVQIAEDYHQQLIVPQRPPNLSEFTAEEIAIADQMMVRFFWKSAKDTGEESHKFIGWIAAELQETIPYSSALLDAAHILGTEALPISKDQIQHARGLEEKAKSLLDARRKNQSCRCLGSVVLSRLCVPAVAAGGRDAASTAGLGPALQRRLTTEKGRSLCSLGVCALGSTPTYT